MPQGRDFRLTATFSLRDFGSAGLKAIGERWGELGKQLSETRALSNLDRQFRVFNRQLQDTADAASDFAGRLAGPFAAISGVVGYTLHQAVFGFQETGAAIERMAKQTGTPVERFQELSYAASQFGVESEDVQDALKTLNEYIVEIGTGDNQELAALFDALGISVRDANGQLRTAADILPEFADGIQRNDNIALQTKMAIAAFGDEAGVRLLPLLQKGGAGIEELSRKAHELGIVMSSDDARAASDMSVAMSNLRQSVAGVTNSIGSALAPAVLQATERLQGLVQSNREAFSAQFVAVADRFVAAFSRIDFEALASGFLTVADYAIRAFDAIGGFNTVIYGLGAVMAGKTLSSLFSLGSSVLELGKSFAGLIPAIRSVGVVLTSVFGLSTGGLGFVLVAAASAVGAIIANWDTIGPHIENAMSSTWSFVSKCWDEWAPKFASVGSAILGIAKGVFTLDFPKVLTGFTDLAKASFNLLPDFMRDGVAGLVKRFQDGLASLADLLKNFDFSSLVPDFVKDLFGGDEVKTPQLPQNAPMVVGAGSQAAMAMASGRMTGSMQVDVYGHGADVTLSRVESSDNLSITGSVGHSDRSGGD